MLKREDGKLGHLLLRTLHGQISLRRRPLFQHIIQLNSSLEMALSALSFVTALEALFGIPGGICLVSGMNDI